MELNLYAPSSAHAGVVDISERVFAEKFNEPLIHQAVTAYLAGGRAGTKAQKSRGQVSGGRKKPWRQKGTGRARAGTIRSPLWRGGGVVFAAVPTDYTQKLNKKMYQGALRSILSELVRQDRLVVVEQFTIDTLKTKALLAKLQEFHLSEVLIVVEAVEENLALAARNLYRIAVCEAGAINPVDLIKFEKVLMTVPALRIIEGRLA